ncbi:RHS repeat-associated core domain-containing protein [Pseudomonas sp. LP_7_YM]|uniref:RHS repeat-associated core domain-containing protein n=1 Tax=Pseudomonas sp. LP_7_YM TaxID=2485137 RepID=UPI0010613829|nr:RHS repeat-associated core domain-containing protein [Pseudomonas sp. LP_7_YM]
MESKTFHQLNFYLDLYANKESRATYASLSIALPLLSAARGVNEDVDDVLVSYIENMYALRGVDPAKLPSAPADPEPAVEVEPVPPARDKSPPAAELAQPPSAQNNGEPTAEVRRQTVEPFAVPYLITTQPDGYLPDMNDFTLERAGSVDDGWYSTVPIKGDRALADGETLSAFLVNRRDGQISRFDCVAQASMLQDDQWPEAFAQSIASQGAAMTAGAWREDNTFSTATASLRLWCHAKYRAFTNAPFTANLVQVLACDDRFQLTVGQTLCLQVRDLKTQALFEQHFFQAAGEQAGAGWSRLLCEQINRDSHLLRAGVLSGGCEVTPADHGNAFWGPQCAELSVTLTLANWWESRKLESARALEAGTTLHAWVYDAFSHRLLAQHEWTPSTAQRGSEKWLTAWATALNTSDVSAYLRAGISSPTDDNLKVTSTDGLGLWQRGDALRIFTSLPDAGNRSAGLALELPEGSQTTDDLQVTVRHPFSGQVLHAAVFTPAPEDESEFDQHAWRDALINFLKDQAWPELHVQPASQAQGDADIWMPRFCELQVDLDPVAADVESAATTASALPTVTFVSTTGSLRITADIHAGELEFRLNRAAVNDGIRIATCVPVVSSEGVAAEDGPWPISVTAHRITWGALARRCTYEVTLDYPVSLYGGVERTIGHIGAFSETQFWQAPQPVSYTPSSALTPYSPTSLLCEDYGNTERSEIFDTLGQGESGVDPRTGLFHAHYPIATLQGLSGLGPICDLTLHYSALRGNEAGLGDGWAWRFSSLNVRDRCLTLANGMRITFTSEEWQGLGEEKPLKKNHCLVQSNKDYSQVTLDLPSGRREVLSKPGAEGSDEEEPNAAFVERIIKMLKAIKGKSKPNFPAVPAHWTQWVLLVLSPAAYYIGAKLDYDEVLSAWEKHGSVKELDERIAYYERPFVQLLPSRIVSLYGEGLDLEWKRQKGQFLLMAIQSGEEALFTAEYLTPDETNAQVNMQVWPTSDERFEVKLRLQSYLLHTLTRTQEKTEEQTKTIIQQVDCDYADDPTLDRVLCRLTELDGSVECVQYRPGIRGTGKPLWPQAVLHALIPGDGQENQVNTYRYTGRLLDTSDQLYIVEGERGAHGAREHHLQVFGLDDQIQRQELVAGSASADSQWLEFKARQSAKAQVIRYTGYGDDLVKAIEQIKLGIRDDKAVLLLGQQQVKSQQAIVELVWSYGLRSRRRLISSIESLLRVCPASQRPALGKAIDMLITEQSDDGLPIKLVTQGHHTLHSAYYPAGGGENIVSAATLNGLSGVSDVPQLSCPKLPDYALRPLMAEYQCDDFGNSLGLKLFGYRSVQRDGRTFLELEQQVVIEGIGVNGTFDGQFLSTIAWVKTAGEVLWRQRVNTVSPVTAKTTPGGESKVREWTLTDKQLTHLGTANFSLETTRICEDNPNNAFIVVRTISKTQAGSQAVSTERCSRYSQRCLERVEQGIETTWAYDAAGRVVDEAQYRLKPGKKGRADDQKADARTETQYSSDGKVATQIHGNGDESRAYLDGLQRTWRSEWRRAGSQGYLPLYECSLQGLDESQVMGSCEWDYLPGGQAVVERAQAQPQQGRQPWVSERGAADVEKEANEAKTRSVKLDKARDLEIYYAGIGGADRQTALEFFAVLTELYGLRESSSNNNGKDIESIINHGFTLGLQIFEWGTYDPLKLIKLLQGIAGRKGDQGIAAQAEFWFKLKRIVPPFPGGSVMYVKEYVDCEILNGGVLKGGYTIEQLPVEFKKLKSIPDFTNVDILNFFSLLDGVSNPEMRGFYVSDPMLFTVENGEGRKVKLVIEQGLSQHRLSQRTTEYLTKTDGTFERTQTLSDGTGQPQLKLSQRLDSNGRVVGSERIVGDETRTYALERDVLGRVTRITRPDSTLIERTYHGFSNQITELKVGGKVVVTQKMANDSTLQSRKVGSRTYTFDDDTVTLPDKTRLHTRVDAEGVQWGASDSAVASLTRKEGVTTVASGSTANDIWKHSFTHPSLPGRIKEAQTTPRGESQSAEWRSLRGTTVATLRSDGHWQRGFVDNEGRVLRTCQEHEDVAYRYDTLGQLQSRQVQALKAGEQWQVLSEHNDFGQEVVRTFLHNGAPRFEQRMTWRGDGRLASKASYEGGLLRSNECFSYDELDRLQRYTCDANDAAHCPEDADGKAVKAQVFTWDALNNLVSCVTTGFDDSVVTRAFSYDDSTDPTRMTAVQRGTESEALAWSDNGYLKAVEIQGPRFAYNACGQLSKVSDADDVPLARYEYDGYQRLAAQYVNADESIRELRYDGDELIGEVWFDKDQAVTRRTSLSAGLAEYDGEQVRWLIDDPQVGVAGQVKDGELSLAPLLPFGEGAVLDGVGVGYNGMRRDPVTGQYHAGNGYRSYDPTLCRYAQPDWLAPVGEGGHNPYQHCPDPVNLHDPSGAIMLSRWEQNLVMQNLDQELKDTQAMEVGGKWRGLALSLVLTVVGVAATVFSGGTASMLLFGALTALSAASFGLEVASVLTAELNPELSKALGIASMAVGVLSAACFMGTIKAGVSLLKQTISAVGRTVRLIGRGAKALGRSVVRLFRGQGRLTRIYNAQLGATRFPLRMRLRTFMRRVGDYLDAPAAPLEPMPTYDRSGWAGKLRSYWDGPDPLNLTGRPARLYEWANRSRFVSRVNEIEGLAIEVNILRGTLESSIALAEGDDSSSISSQARASLRGNNPYKPRHIRPRYELWTALGLSG